MADPLIWARVLHFASTVLLSGTALFLSFVAAPAYGSPGGKRDIRTIMRSRLVPLGWITSILVLVSGVAWFLLQTATIADLPVSQIFSTSAASTVLTQTGFGRDWSARLLLLAMLAWATLRFDPAHAPSRWKRSAAAALAAALVGSLAWAGHGAAGSGIAGAAHLTSDVLHLVAAAAWVGALVPLAIFLGITNARDEPSRAIARGVVLRFSTLGTISVCTLVATGILNSWMLVGSLNALLATGYGRLLLLKIALFIAMLATAAINRLLLTPRLLRADVTAAQTSLRQLTNNSVIEAGFGAAILVIVGVLGTLPPGIEGR